MRAESFNPFRNPFRITPSDAPLGMRIALTAAAPPLSWLLKLPEYRRLYAYARTLPHATFEERALATLAVQPIAADTERALIPSRGPLIVAANHPHGILDGLVLASTLKAIRPDVRLLANHVLARIPELRDLCFFVDPFGGPSAAALSQSGLRAAHLWVRNGGALIVFPAGEVAHTSCDGPQKCSTHIDSPWKVTIGRLVRTTGAPVIPAFIAGANSRLFYAAGRLHPALRTALLARECLKARGRSITVRFGPPVTGRDVIPSSEAEAATMSDAAGITLAIRERVERLAKTPAPSPSSSSSGVLPFTPADSVAAEIGRLPSDACLVESGAFQVFCAEARLIPATLREIGRLREVTYRAIGEGTGRAIDLDAFDDRYLHLFSWDRERRQIAGAYRIGRTDTVLAQAGVAGLYTRSLFKYDERLIAKLSPALELGRSFVTADYQRNYNALLLLWKGIGQFVVRHPQYRVLFGPVSISTRYSDSSHRLLMSFLLQNHRDASLAELVEALHPSTMRPAPAAVPSATIPTSIDDVNRMVSALETDGKGVPVLLRQYLKLNARLLGFNVDPDFGDALDALMMVDLTRVDPTILTRYLGREGVRMFLARHAAASADAA